MPIEQLTPFSPPAFFAQLGWQAPSAGSAVIWLFGAAAIFWAAYTLVAVYHWLKYSHASWVAFPAIAIHLFVSFTLFTYAVSGTLPAFISNLL